MSQILTIKKLTKTFTSSQGLLGLKKSTITAVNNINLDLEQGKILGLVGESGCGKSTLSKLISGLLPPDNGKILINNKELSALPSKKRASLVQMVFQDPFSSLNPRQKVGKSISEVLRISSTLSSSEIKYKVDSLLHKVGLRPEHANRYPHEFSGGQRQRIAIARAVSISPKLLICDEPVSALDVSVQAQVLNLLRELRKEYNLSIIFISHDLSVVSNISDETAVMYNGHIIEQGLNSEIYSNPLHPYTKLLIDSVPIADPNYRVNKDFTAPKKTSNILSNCIYSNKCDEINKKCKQVVEDYTFASTTHKVLCSLYK